MIKLLRTLAIIMLILAVAIVVVGIVFMVTDNSAYIRFTHATSGIIVPAIILLLLAEMFYKN